ncbi:MAG: hypothetical protein CMP65_02890 [Flavobacteriales bacterium]|nr:hypothetical protein [Flavobacteriales bacterium]|tara:strand:+ start:10473 stop:11243 length:771 start_codon:yes stop_codon:yes gene_type:complete
MKNLTLIIIHFFCLFNFGLSQHQDTNKILEQAFKKINSQNGFNIEFEYNYNAPAFNNNPITGNIALFDNNRFYLKFNDPTNIIQINDGKKLMTIMIHEKEITIDTVSNTSFFFLRELFVNYKNKFTSKIIADFNKQLSIELTPKKSINQLIYNHCVNILNLPSCLQFPNQCRIGLSKENTASLNKCLEENNGYEKIDIEKIIIDIDKESYLIKSVTQQNKNQGIGKISIINTSTANQKCLQLDTIKYSKFEIIDLR